MRINGVKAIMLYLGIKDRRTYRKKRNKGLPVHYDEDDTGRVWALSQELDRWDHQHSKHLPEKLSRGHLPVHQGSI